MPDDTLPKMVCFPSSHGVGPSVRKNWLPAVSSGHIEIHSVIGKVEGKRGKRLTVRVGSRVGHGEDTGSYEPQFRVDLVRTLHRPS